MLGNIVSALISGGVSLIAALFSFLPEIDISAIPLVPPKESPKSWASSTGSSRCRPTYYLRAVGRCRAGNKYLLPLLPTRRSVKGGLMT